MSQSITVKPAHPKAIRTEDNAGRITQLDGIRGIAILLVMGFHYINNQYSAIGHPLPLVPRILLFSTHFGWCGVDLFFVLSGFLIGSILLKNRGKSHFFKTFYIRRFCRIIPVYFLLLLVFMGLMHSPWYTTDAYLFEKPLPMASYFLFLQNFLMGSRHHFGPEALTHTWSLAVEEQFYLLIPFIVYYIRPKYLLHFILFLIVLGPICRQIYPSWYQSYTLLACRIDSPGFGLLIAWLLYNQRTRTYITTNIKMLLWVFIPIFIVCTTLVALAVVGRFNHSLLAIDFSCLILLAVCLPRGPLHRLLTQKWLIQLGALSYFIYLFHPMINGLLHLVILHQLTPVLDSPAAYGLTLLALIITLVLAKVSYRYFEQPLINYGHSFKYGDQKKLSIS